MTVYLHKYSGVLPAGDVFNFGWHSDTGVSLAASHAAGVTWGNDFWSGLLAFGSLVTSGTVWQRTTTYQLQPLLPFHTVAVLATDVTAPGSAADPTLPQDTAEVVSLRSADPSRRGRGRMYLPALASASLTANGEISAAAAAVILSSLGAAWTASRAAGDNPVVFSRTTGLTQPVLQYGVGTVFDRQSRRVNKVSTVRTFDAMP
jgi:hypothetical protein